MSNTEDQLKIRVWLNIGVSNADQDDEFISDDYTKSEWDALPDKEKEDYLDMIARDHASNYLDCGAEVIDEKRN